MSNGWAIRYEFDPLDQHTIGGVALRYVSSDRNGIVFARVDDPAIHRGFTHAEFEACRRLPDYHRDVGWFDPVRIRMRLRTGSTFIAHVDPAEQRIIVFRAAVCTLFMKMEEAGEASRSDESIERAMATIAPQIAHLPNVHNLKKDGTPKRSRYGATNLRGLPGPKCLRDWLSRLKAASYNPQALQTHYDNCGPRTSVIGPDVRTVALVFITRFASGTKPSKSELYTDFKTELARVNATRGASGQLPLKLPSRKWFNAEIEDLDAYEVYAKRHGPDAARAKFSLFSHGVDAVRPLQRIEMDEWEVSLMVLVIDAGLWPTLDDKQKAAVQRAKCYICVAICVATRCIVGMNLSRTPSSRSALATLRMVVTDKGRYADACGALTPWDMHGGLDLDSEIVTDGGSSFTKSEFSAGVLNLGGTVHITASGVPFLRARVERVFRTIHTYLIARFAGRTFENTVRRGDYPSQKQANLFVEQLQWVLCRYVVDIYHNLPHAGLGGETPRNAWLRLTRDYEVKQPPDRRALRAAFGRRLTCKLSGRGVRVLGLYYQSLHLHDYFKKVGETSVEVRVDDCDLGAVSVRVGEPFLTVPCILSDFTNVSLREWMQTATDLRLRYADAAKVSEPIVQETLRAFRSLRENAEIFTGITPDTIGEAELAQLDRSLTYGFIPMEPEVPTALEGDRDFDDVIPIVPQPAHPAAAEQTQATPGDDATDDTPPDFEIL